MWLRLHSSVIMIYKKQEGLLYMPYLTLGDPSLSKSYEFALAMIDAGADLLELGIPFSDPVADGPTIQAAMDRALSANFSIKDIFILCRKIHTERPHIPLIFLSYFNPIINAFSLLEARRSREEYIEGLSKNLGLFLQECQASGIRGLVIPDLPFDQLESEILRALASRYELSQILMVLPNTSPQRLAQICEVAQAWLYYVSGLGVTGIRKSMAIELGENIKKVRRLTKLPILAGFGFHQPEQIIGLRGVVDGVIVGSLNQNIIAQKGANAREELGRITRSFVQVCHTK